MPTLKTQRRRLVGRPSPSSAASRADAKPVTELVVFPTELGWMAAVVRKDVKRAEMLLELTFGHDSPQKAVAGLASPAAAAAQATSRKPPLVRLLQAFARGERADLCEIHVDLTDLAPFARRVVELCRVIPYGQTLTYGELATKAGSPRAARAVGNVMRTNRCPLVVPCHRVVPRGPGLGGYSAPGGVRAKLRLLELEGSK